MPFSQWRLIPLLEANGFVQMAIDTWLFEQHQQGLQPPTLRFYTWNPVAISLGYHQRRIPEKWRSLSYNSVPVDRVRRPSGGRAVLHQGDLTYAVITSGLPANRMQAYQQICQFLIEGWRSLDVSLHYGEAGRGYIHNPNCFGTATVADLVMPDGFKLIGSAQLRRGDAVLQHGSIRLAPDPWLFEQVFGEPMQASGRVAPVSVTELIVALTQAAERCFNVQLVSQPLTDLEWREVGAIADQIASETRPTQQAP